MKLQSEPQLSPHFLIACVGSDQLAVKIVRGTVTKEEIENANFHWVNPVNGVRFINDEPLRRKQGITAIRTLGGSWIFALMQHKDLMKLMQKHGVVTYGLPEQAEIRENSKMSLER